MCLSALEQFHLSSIAGWSASQLSSGEALPQADGLAACRLIPPWSRNNRFPSGGRRSKRADPYATGCLAPQELDTLSPTGATQAKLDRPLRTSTPSPGAAAVRRESRWRAAEARSSPAT